MTSAKKKSKEDIHSKNGYPNIIVHPDRHIGVDWD